MFSLFRFSLPSFLTKSGVHPTLLPAFTRLENPIPTLLPEAVQKGLARLILGVFFASQVVLPVKIVQAQTAPQNVAPPTNSLANVATAELKSTNEQKQGDPKSKVCRKCRVSPKALDLTREPTEDELIQSGQMDGPMAPLFSASVPDLEDRYDKELKQMGVPNGLKAQLNLKSVAGQEVSKRRKKVERMRSMNWDFGHAMQAWNKGKYRRAQKLFTKYLEQHKDSPWAAEVMIHLGELAKNDGDAGQARIFFDFVRDNTSSDATDPTWDIHRKSKLQLASLSLATGDFSQASSQFKEVIENDTDWRRQAYATSWLMNLSHYESNIRQLRACGSQALGFIFASLGKEDASRKLYKLEPSRDEGFNLDEMARLSTRFGAPMGGFRATPEGLASLPMPLVIHYDYRHNASAPAEHGGKIVEEKIGFLPTQVNWTSIAAQQRKSDGDEECCGTKANPKPKAQQKEKHAPTQIRTATAKSLPNSATSVGTAPQNSSNVENVGHFVVVRSVNVSKRLASLYDPQTKRKYTVSFEQLEREWSGTGLVLKQQAQEFTPNSPEPQSRMAKTEAPNSKPVRLAWLSPEEMKAIVGGCCGAPCRQLLLGSNGVFMNGGGGCGAPSWGVNKTTMNFYMEHSPLGYKTEVGPDVNFSLAYNSFDGTNLNTPFGNKWSFGYGGYLREGIVGDCARNIYVEVRLTADYKPSPEDRERIERTKSGAKQVSFQQANGVAGPPAFRQIADAGDLEEIPGTVTIFMPDGEQNSYAPDGNGGYMAEVGNHSTLANEGSRWVLTSQTGEQFIYSIPNGTNSLVPFLTEVRDAYGYSLRFGYDQDVHLTTVMDAQGRVSRLFYDAEGHVIRIADPFGRQAFFAYDAAGNLVQIVNGDGQTFEFRVDNRVTIDQIRTAQGVWGILTEWPGGSYGGDYNSLRGPMGNNMRITITNPLNASEEFYYCASKFISWKNTPRGSLKGPFVWYIDHNNYVFPGSNINNLSTHSPRMIWGSQQVVAGKPMVGDVLSLDGTWTFTAYNQDNGLPNSFQVIDGYGLNARFTYNNQGRLTSIRDGWNRVTSINYAANGIDATSIVNPRGVRTMTATYDGAHQPTSVTDTAGRTTDISYTQWGATSAVTNPIGETTLYNYDPLSKRVATITQNGAMMAGFTYDNQNRVRSATDAAGRTTSYVYDGLGTVTQTALPDNSKTEQATNCCGLPGMTTDRSGRKTYYDYDPLKRLIRVQDASGNTLQLDYLPGGQLRRIVDAKGNTTRFVYDDANRLTRKTYADGTFESYAYDTFNGAVAYRDATGAVTTLRTDAGGRLAEIDYPNQSDVRFTYDELDQVREMKDGLGTTTWNYDNLDRLTSEDGPFANDVVRYGYDDLDRLNEVSVNGTDSTTYDYDGLDRLKSVRGWGGTFAPSGTWNYAYDSNQVGNLDLPTQVSLPNGTKTLYAYDQLERLTGMEHRKTDNTLLSSFGYGFDNINNKDARQSLVRQVRGADNTLSGVQTVSFGYDTVDQLQEEASTGAAPTSALPAVAQSHRFDAMGNRTLWNDAQNKRRSDSIYNEVNQLTQSKSYDTNTAPATLLGTTNFGYDPKGNLTATATTNGSGGPSGSATYVYDDADRLTGITNPGSSKREFLYDGMSRMRVSRNWNWQNGAWVPQSETRRVYDGMDVVQERDGSNAVTANYTRLGNIGGILARSTSAGNVYFGYDGGGNVTELTDNTGSVVGTYAYDAFGNIVATSGAAAASNPYRFSTKEDLGGLYYYGFRFYSPGMGRWLNPDPLREGGGLNVYAMVGNNPLNYVDGDGLLGVAVEGKLFGRKFRIASPFYGWGGPDFLFDQGSADNLGEDLKKGWYPAADGLNPFGDPYKDLGYWSECDSNSQWSYGLGVLSQQALVTAALSPQALASVGRAAFATRSGEAIFWSGEGAQAAAHEYSLATGGKVLGQTIGGRAAVFTNRVLEIAGVPDAVRWNKIWVPASRAFAQNAEGPVIAFLRQPTATSMWTTVEQPALQAAGTQAMRVWLH